MALWLHRQMPEGVRILVSPAGRAQHRVKLERKFTHPGAIGPQAKATDLLQASGWPEGQRTVLLVGHQPALGDLGVAAAHWARGRLDDSQGGGGWLRHRSNESERDSEGRAQTYLVCVQSPRTM